MTQREGSHRIFPFVFIYIDKRQGLIYTIIVKKNLDNKGED